MFFLNCRGLATTVSTLLHSTRSRCEVKKSHFDDLLSGLMDAQLYLVLWVVRTCILFDICLISERKPSKEQTKQKTANKVRDRNCVETFCLFALVLVLLSLQLGLFFFFFTFLLSDRVVHCDSDSWESIFIYVHSIRHETNSSDVYRTVNLDHAYAIKVGTSSRQSDRILRPTLFTCTAAFILNLVWTSRSDTGCTYR